VHSHSLTTHTHRSPGFNTGILCSTVPPPHLPTMSLKIDDDEDTATPSSSIRRSSGTSQPKATNRHRTSSASRHGTTSVSCTSHTLSPHYLLSLVFSSSHIHQLSPSCIARHGKPNTPMELPITPLMAQQTSVSETGHSTPSSDRPKRSAKVLFLFAHRPYGSIQIHFLMICMWPTTVSSAEAYFINAKFSIFNCN
jgi:hypothetical protein